MTAHTRETVLVVDDSALVRRLVCGRLEMAGYHAIEAGDGAEALAAYELSPVPVVITDINMPQLDGLELLARLRAFHPAPEVILLTASRADDAAAAIQALRLGAYDYLTKEAARGDAVVLAVRNAAERRRLQDENEALLAELRRLSLTDPLTAVGNRRALDESLRQEIARARRSGAPLGLVLLDIDHFKRVNDSLGHPAGDELLANLATRLRGWAREADRVFRHGGEEFAVVLGDTPLAGAMVLASRFVEGAAVEPFRLRAGEVTLTCSAGAAALEPGDDPDGVSLMARADAALYEAKRQGRNRVCRAPEEAGPSLRPRPGRARS